VKIDESKTEYKEDRGGMYRILMKRYIEDQVYALIYYYYDESDQWGISTEDPSSDFHTTLKSFVDSLSIKKWSRKIQKAEMPSDVVSPIIDTHMSEFLPGPTKSSLTNNILLDTSIEEVLPPPSSSSSSSSPSSSSSIAYKEPLLTSTVTRPPPLLELIYESFKVSLVGEEEDLSFGIVLSNDAITLQEHLWNTDSAAIANQYRQPRGGDIMMVIKQGHRHRLPRIVSTQLHPNAPEYVYIVYAGSAIVRCGGQVCKGDFLVVDTLTGKVHGVSESQVCVAMMDRIVGISLIETACDDNVDSLVSSLVYYPDEAWLSRTNSSHITQDFSQLQVDYRQQYLIQESDKKSLPVSYSVTAMEATVMAASTMNLADFADAKDQHHHIKVEKGRLPPLPSSSSSPLPPTSFRRRSLLSYRRRRLRWGLATVVVFLFILAFLILGLYLGGLLTSHRRRGNDIFPFPIDGIVDRHNTTVCFLPENRLNSLCDLFSAASFDWSCRTTPTTQFDSDIVTVKSLSGYNGTEHVLALVTSSHIESTQCQQQLLNMDPGQTYFYSAYVKPQISMLSVTWTLMFPDQGIVCNSSHIEGMSGGEDSSWRLIETSCSVPSGVSSLLMMMNVTNTNFNESMTNQSSSMSLPSESDQNTSLVSVPKLPHHNTSLISSSSGASTTSPPPPSQKIPNSTTTIPPPPPIYNTPPSISDSSKTATTPPPITSPVLSPPITSPPVLPPPIQEPSTPTTPTPTPPIATLPPITNPNPITEPPPLLLPPLYPDVPSPSFTSENPSDSSLDNIASLLNLHPLRSPEVTYRTQATFSRAKPIYPNKSSFQNLSASSQHDKTIMYIDMMWFSNTSILSHF
jgi:hypothetical protein